MGNEFLSYLFDEESIDFLFNNVEPFVLGVTKVRSERESDLPVGFQYSKYTQNGKHYKGIRVTFKVYGKRVKVEQAYEVDGLEVNGGKEDVLRILKHKALRLLIRKISEKARTEKISDNYANTLKKVSKNKFTRVIDNFLPRVKQTSYEEKRTQRVSAAFIWIFQKKFNGLKLEGLAYYTVKELLYEVTTDDFLLYWKEIADLKPETQVAIYMSIKRFYQNFDVSFKLPALPDAE